MYQRALSQACTGALLTVFILCVSCSKKEPTASAAPANATASAPAMAQQTPQQKIRHPHPVGEWQGKGEPDSDESYDVILALGPKHTYWMARYHTRLGTTTEVEEGGWSFSNNWLRLNRRKSTSYSENSYTVDEETVKEKLKSRSRANGVWKLADEEYDGPSQWSYELAAMEPGAAIALRDTWIKNARHPSAVQAAASSAAPTPAPAQAAAPSVPRGSMYDANGTPCSGRYHGVDGVCVHDKLLARPDIATAVANYKLGAAPPPMPE